MTQLIDFAILTIFAREFLEGSIIIGEYRTIIIRGGSLQHGVGRDEALRVITLSALFATAFALLVIAAIAIPLAALSRSFDPTTAKIIEGVSKIVAALSLLLLSLKLPKWLGVYGSAKEKRRQQHQGSVRRQREDEEEETSADLVDTDAEFDAEEGASRRGTNGRGEESAREEEDEDDGMALGSIRFNVAWNIWREVAE